MDDAAVGWTRARLSVAWLLAVLALAAAAFGTPVRAQSAAPVVLTLRGDETPETIRKMVDALSGSGRQVEVRLGGTSVPPPAPAAKAASAKSSPAAPAPVERSMADDEGFQGQLNQLVDRVVDGLDYGSTAIPSIARLPLDWEQAWGRNVNGRSGPSAGWRSFGILCLALALAFAFRIAGAAWFARRRQPAGPEFTPRLIASGWGLLQDVATIMLALVTVRLARNAWLPESDLAMFALTVATNGAAIGALYVAIGRFLLAPAGPSGA